MASSTGSLETSANTHPSFTFSTQFMNPSFSELLSGDDEFFIQNRGLSDRGVPKFKSIPPPSLPISPPALSPSSYFSIPPGLSPAELLDSPILLSTSNILPSPTTGSFSQGFNWRNYGNYQQSVKQEDRNYSDFSFQPQKRAFNESTSIFQSAKSAVSTEETLSRQQHQTWNFQEPNKKTDFSSGKTTIKSEFIPIQSFSPEISTIQENTESNGGFKSEYNNYTQPSQTLREQSRAEDGYNWRKYGQKQVKGSENPRSYYKCTYPNCPIKKQVERSLEGQITEIVYKGNHNHPEPQSTRRSSASSQQIQASSAPISEIPDQSFIKHNITQTESATPENSSISFGDDFDQSSQRTKSEGDEFDGDEFDEDEPETKRWKRECESEGISAPGNRTVREPKVVVQTISDIDILIDGYRWRKYGQKVVKGNPNPRSYYKCTSLGCPVRKLVERASHDIRAVITTYEGKHNHDIPAARGSGNNMVKNNNNNNNVSTAIRPSAIINHPNNTIGNILRSIKAPSCEGKAPFTLKMMDSPGSFGFSGFGNSMDSYMNQSQHAESEFLRAKEEEVRDDMFLESLLFS